jgi:hypothetical protein
MVVLDVDVRRHVRSHGVVGELDCSPGVFIVRCGTALLSVDILYQLPEVHKLLPGPADRHVLRFCGGESHLLAHFACDKSS